MLQCTGSQSRTRLSVLTELTVGVVIPVELLVFPEVSTYLFYVIDKNKHVFI